MPDYSHSKIYKIIDNTNGNIYIGSTTQSLSQRLGGHKREYKRYCNGRHNFVSSFEILKNDNYEIVLIEEVNCENKEQLHKIERKHIETNKCVNLYIPTRTKEEYYESNKDEKKEWNKEYYESNKDKILEKNKEWYEANKDKILEYNVLNKDKIKQKHKEWCEANKDKIKQKQKEYYEENKDKYKKEYNKEYYEANKDKYKEYQRLYREKKLNPHPTDAIDDRPL
jgi:hypothetical protein